MKKVLISACLLGEKVRYDGNSLLNSSDILKGWLKEGRVVSVCPEVIAGMTIPREPCEILGGDGDDILFGKASVIEKNGRDVTDYFLNGANVALSLCKENDIEVAILSEFSPSCGSSSIYNGDFSGTKIPGLGVTAALLIKNGIKVYSQYQLAEANRQLHQTG